MLPVPVTLVTLTRNQGWLNRKAIVLLETGLAVQFSGFDPSVTFAVATAVQTPHGEPEQSSELSTWMVIAVNPVGLNVSLQDAAPLVAGTDRAAPAAAPVKVWDC
jgi:hypothetical protein